MAITLVLLIAVLGWLFSAWRCNYYMNAIRLHRDQHGDDRCWEDDVTMYKKLPEGYEAPKEDVKVQLEFCQKYIACRHNPNTVYVSPQRRIEQLEAEIVDLQKEKRSHGKTKR